MPTAMAAAVARLRVTAPLSESPPAPDLPDTEGLVRKCHDGAELAKNRTAIELAAHKLTLPTGLGRLYRENIPRTILLGPRAARARTDDRSAKRRPTRADPG